MKITVLSSGSLANGYVLHNDTEALVIECGCNLLTLEKALKYRLSKVSGCIVSHEHKDHAKYIKDYAQYVPIYATRGTLEKANCADHSNCTVAKYLVPLQIGHFKVLPFKTQHDAEEPCGFLINHPDLRGSLLFATDTYYLKYKFKNLAYIMIECNYDKDILYKNVLHGDIHRSLAKRVQQSHLSLKQCIATLQANDLTNVSSIMLIHVSRNNGNLQSFRNAVAAATGKYVVVAENGTELICL